MMIVIWVVGAAWYILMAMMVNGIGKGFDAHRKWDGIMRPPWEFISGIWPLALAGWITLQLGNALLAVVYHCIVRPIDKIGGFSGFVQRKTREFRNRNKIPKMKVVND